MYLIFVLIVCVLLEEVFSSRALSLRHGFRAREAGEFGAFYPDFQDFQVNTVDFDQNQDFCLTNFSIFPGLPFI